MSKLPYPDNLIKAIFKEQKELNADQIAALDHLIEKEHNDYIRMHYKDGLTYKQIAEQNGISTYEATNVTRRRLRGLELQSGVILRGIEGSETYAKIKFEETIKRTQACLTRLASHTYYRELLAMKKENPKAFRAALAIYKYEHKDTILPIEHDKLPTIEKRDGAYYWIDFEEEKQHDN